MLAKGTKIKIKPKRKSMCSTMWEGTILSHKDEKYYQVKITDADPTTKLNTRMFSKEFIEESYEVLEK